MKKLYLFLLYLIFPFIWLRLLFRARKAPLYAKNWNERLGRAPFQLEKESIWIHAASLGETIAATPIVKFLQQQFPDTPIVLTAMTPTGRARAQTLLNENTHACYVPYDYPFAIKAFLKRANPKSAIFIETELWPNIIFLCEKNHIPFVLTNARMSEKSKQGYLRFAPLVREMMQKVSCIAAQTTEDAKRLAELGVDENKIQVTGSLKFDLTIPLDLIEKSTQLREHIGLARPVFIAASTHEGEEVLLLEAFLKLREKFNNALLILVPRHPERFSRVVAMCEKTNLTVARRSQMLPTLQTDIYVGDTVGELLLLYGAADLGFVGGSLIPRGGHNPLEPAALGIPVLMGPHVFNFAEITRLLVEAGGLRLVKENELSDALIDAFSNPKARLERGLFAKQVVENNRGALEKQLTLITSFL